MNRKSPDPDSFGNKLKTLRGRVSALRPPRGLTQDELAELVEVSQTTIDKWENDKTKIKQKNLQKIIEVYFELGAFKEGEEEIKDLWALADINVAFDKHWFKEMLLSHQGTLDSTEQELKEEPLPISSDVSSGTEIPEQPNSSQLSATKRHITRRSLLKGFAAGITVGGIIGSVITHLTPQDEARWVATGSMLQDRRDFRATLLKNGKVLIEGGYTSNEDSTAESELFDATTGVWTKTRMNLNEKRSQHTATRLQSGKVLVTGGYENIGEITRASTEIYDPVTDTWTFTKQLMSIERARHTATLLPNGKVLVAGGVRKDTAELYDPITDTWSPAGTMVMSRADHIAVLMQNRKVLVAGGTFDNDGKSITSMAEEYDPSTNTWSSTADMNIERAYFTGVSLPDGKVLVIGGRQHSRKSTPTTEVYDPVMGTWSWADSMLYPRENTIGQEALLLENGLILVVGGDEVGTCEIYSTTTKSWISLLKLSSRQFNGATSLLPKGQVLIAGGDDKNGQRTNAVEIYIP